MQPRFSSSMSHFIKIINRSNPAITPIQAKYCDDFFSRLCGFTFRWEIKIDEGLVLVERRESRVETSIHMLFVWTDLAVLWLDSSFCIVDKVLARSWRPYYAPGTSSRYVVELNPSRLDEYNIGDTLEFVK